VGGEEAEDIGGTGGQNDVEGVAAGDLVEDLGEVEHGFRPRLKLRELERMGVCVIELRTAAFNFIVQGLDADFEAAGFGTAEVVVLHRGKAGECGEGVGSV
jgi:hypothetical protein